MTHERRIIILGSTGSIGVSTLEVVAHLNALAESGLDEKAGHDYLRVVGLAANSNAQRLSAQARELGVRHIALADDRSRHESVSFGSSVTVFTGPDAAQRLVEEVDADLVVAAIVGSAGLSAVMAGIRKGCDIALANKETLVAAGELVMPLAMAGGVRLLPIDSEHSAIFQCLQSSKVNRNDRHGSLAGHCADEISRIVLTASGGPFRTWSTEQIRQAGVDEALNHPTWNMGAKITIDSASLTNKALEIIEAHWLFGIPSEQIEVIVHPQSIIHSFVEFRDGSVIGQLGAPDMKTPIQYALTYPHRPCGCARRLDWRNLAPLTFEAPDPERFPALHHARTVIDAGGTAGAIFNAANEAAVGAFLNRQIPFGAMMDVVNDAMREMHAEPLESLEQVFEADRWAREFVQRQLNRQLA